jgi:hypothetical protein
MTKRTSLYCKSGLPSLLRAPQKLDQALKGLTSIGAITLRFCRRFYKTFITTPNELDCLSLVSLSSCFVGKAWSPPYSGAPESFCTRVGSGPTLEYTK